MNKTAGSRLLSVAKEQPGVTAFAILGFMGGIICILFGSISEKNHHPLDAIFLIALGTLLSGSIAVGIVFEALLSESRALVVRAQLSSELNEQLSPIKFSGVEAGVHGVQSVLDFHGLFSGLTAKDELLWLDTSAPQYPWYKDSLRELLRQGLNMKVLVLNPSCENAKCRAIESAGQFDLPEGDRVRAIEAYQNVVDSAILTLRLLGQDVYEHDPRMQGRLQVALYTDLPGVPLYVVRRRNQPEKAWSSFFLNDATYLQVHFEWIDVGDNCMAERFADYFDRKWNRSIAQPNGLAVDIPPSRPLNPAQDNHRVS